MHIYDRLGVRRIINGNATLTRLGGSRMPPPVLEAMAQAADSFVDVHDLQRKAGERIAELTRNEAAYVCNGAAAGLFLTTLACITRGDLKLIARLPDLTGMRDEVIMFGGQRNPYDLAVRQTGARLVQVGSPVQTLPWELEAAITDRTAALVYIAGEFYARGSLPLPETIEICHRHGVPVIVDAAAQLPPPDNLWRFTRELGADLVVFSGGKGLQGPQSSGLILGRRDLVEAVREVGPPHQRPGRPMKVGREEICGLVAAVEWYLSLDHAALAEQYERQVAHVIQALAGLSGVTASRAFPNEAGQPAPRALVRLDAAVSGRTRDQLLQVLLEGEPPIDLAPAGADGLYVNPLVLTEEETTTVAARLAQLLTPRSALVPIPVPAPAR